jgi:mannose-6-phosphate isomerase-like protein (cupin superfamily)
MADTAEVWRIFTLPDGRSSMERIQVALPGGRSGLIAGKGVQLVSMQPSTNVDWHVGPRRQMIATLAGQGEMEMGDGQKLVMKPGVITLIEDLTGQGHITRNGPQGRLCVFLPLDDEAKVE